MIVTEVLEDDYVLIKGEKIGLRPGTDLYLDKCLRPSIIFKKGLYRVDTVDYLNKKCRKFVALCKFLRSPEYPDWRL
jgi:hypothetical protein